MSNKAVSSLGVAGIDLFAWADEQIFSGEFYATTSTVSNNPVPGAWLVGHLGLSAAGVQLMQVTEPYSGRKFEARTFNGKWQEWIEIATVTPPQEFALSLAAGLTDAGSEYRKNQFNEVTVGLAVSGTIAADAVVATLPAGYRPKAGKQMAVTAISTAGTAVAGFCLIEATTGHIINQCGAVAKLVGELAFVAG